VIVLLKTHFYITEGLQQRNRLLFYRPRVHQRSSDLALAHMVTSKKLLRIGKPQAAKLEKTEVFPGTGVLRFIPKKTGVRPILRIRYCS
jgi:hypothetical protein